MTDAPKDAPEGAPDNDGDEAGTERAAKRRPVARGTSLRRPATSETEGADSGRAPADKAPVDKAAAEEVSPTEAGADTGDEKAVASTPVDGETDGEADGAPSRGSNRLPIAILAAALVIAVVAVLVTVIRPGAQSVDNRAFVDTALTTEVTSVAKQAAKNIYTIDMNDLSPWEKGLDGVLTEGMVEEAKKLRTAITQTAGALQDVKVKVDDGDLTAGVSLARTDHAEVLLNVRQQVSTQGVPFATMQSPMKFVLDRFDGKWKVSSITPL